MQIFKVDANFLWQDEMNALGGNSTKLKYDEMQCIKKYRFISKHSPLGAREVTACLNREYSIAEQLLAKDSRISQLEATWGKKIRFIQYYQRLASAGTGQIVFDTPPTELIEIPDLPKYKYVKYAIGVNGDSMEPKYHDGDILLIEPTEEIDIGEVGIFIVDNEAYVKELGAKELISLNHDYPNIQLTKYSRCMGRVIDKLEDKIK